MKKAPTFANAIFAALVVIAAASVAVYGYAQTQASATGPSVTAAEKYKNIQVLKNVPADQLIPAMQFISASLGVECDFCHVEGADNRLEFNKDDKKEKKTAREMMQMMFAINAQNFKGERAVTCNTCHHGSPSPQAIPAVLAEGPKPIPEHEHATDSSALPSGEPVLATFLQAIGGDAALSKVTTRVETGKALMPEGESMPITIYTKAPDQRVSVMRTPKGDSVTAYNGVAGWLLFPGRPPRLMAAADELAARLDATAFYPANLAKQFTALKLQPHPEKIGDNEADVVLAEAKDQAPVKLYFDRNSGLLVRMVHYTNTPLGLLPTQVDYADYREVGGVKTPYRWTLGRPSGSFSIQLDKVEQNVAIDESRFTEPTFAPAGVPQGGGAHPASGPMGPKPPQGAVPPTAAPSNPAPGDM